MATTNVATPLPDITWPDQAVITVDSGDNNALVSSVVIHLSQDVPDDVAAVAEFTPAFVYSRTTA